MFVEMNGLKNHFEILVAKYLDEILLKCLGLRDSKVGIKYREYRKKRGKKPGTTHITKTCENVKRVSKSSQKQIKNYRDM